MLTKPFVNATCRQGVIHPRFVTATPQNLALCEQLLEIYRDAALTHTPLGEMEDYLKPIVTDASNPRFVQALRKILDDQCEFSSLSQLDFPALRRELFQASAALLKGDAPLPNGLQWQTALKAVCPSNALLAGGQLYGDLPENDCLLKFDEPTAEQLLERYNTGLVQAILMSAKSMRIKVGSEDAPRLRRLCQYLRFFQLLADVRNIDEPEDIGESDGLRWLEMQVDGPASVLEQGRKYGLQLATFFPAVCTMQRWELEAQIEWDDKTVTLKLDDSTGLKCPYHQFSAYIPDEIRLFKQHIQENYDTLQWKIVEDSPFLKGAGREIIFPDFSFRKKKSRTIVHLELFHRWHPRGLKERLEWLEKHPKTPLVVGVERTLQKNEETAALLENSKWFQEYGFLYRDYPTVDKTLKALQKCLDRNDSQ